MKSRQQATAERPPAKRRGPKPSISDEALLVAIEADLEASPWEGEGHRKVWARLRVCRGIRVSRKRVLRVMRENNLLSPHRCRRRGGNPHVGEIITHAPNLMWGTDGVRVFRWTTAGAGYSPPFIGTPSASAGMVCKRTASPGFSRSPWGLRGCMPRPRRCGAGAGLADGSRLAVSVGPRSPTSQVLGHPAVLRLRRSPRPTASPRGSITLKEQIIHWPHLPQHRAAEPAGSSNSTMPSGSWRRTATWPRSSSSGVAHRDVTQARRMRQTCSRNRVRYRSN